MDPIEPVVQIIKHLEVGPGDTIVISIPHRLPTHALERTREALAQMWGSGVKVVIMEDGMKVEGVLRFGENGAKDAGASTKQ